ncbi:hypothetical protein EBT25_07750, partial [bacterium]|nr:hypothetical protein [bacterium]
MALRPLKQATIGGQVTTQEMTNAELDAYVVQLIAEDFASTVGVGSVAVGSMANGTSIGAFTDTSYPGTTTGNHPINQSPSSTVTTLYQNYTTATGTPTRPLVWSSSLNALQQIDDTTLQTTIISRVASYVAGGGVGSYTLSTTTPVGGTWVNRGTITNYFDDVTSNNIYL